jgi:pimeloyl-ACP methyl ester carboxylesterase
MTSRTGDAPAVAWLHGYTMSSAVFGPLWGLLPGVRHVGIDLPGHGTATAEPVPDLTTTAAGIADRLRAERCRMLVGLSFGSCVALQVALDHPDCLDALVLAAPTLAGEADDPPARARYLLLRALYPQLGPGPQLADVWMADPPAIFTGLRRHPEAFAAVRAVVAAHSFAELATGAVRRLTDGDHGPQRLATLRTPVLLVVGDEDMPRFLGSADLLERSAPDVERVTVGGAGHLPLLERPEECAASLERFLARRVRAA